MVYVYTIYGIHNMCSLCIYYVLCIIYHIYMYCVYHIVYTYTICSVYMYIYCVYHIYIIKCDHIVCHILCIPYCVPPKIAEIALLSGIWVEYGMKVHVSIAKWIPRK